MGSKFSVVDALGNLKRKSTNFELLAYFVEIFLEISGEIDSMRTK